MFDRYVQCTFTFNNTTYLYLLYIKKFQFIFVAGGYSGSAYMDTTEIFSYNVWRTVPAKLPASMGKTSSMGVATINNRVLCFGNQCIF